LKAHAPPSSSATTPAACTHALKKVAAPPKHLAPASICESVGVLVVPGAVPDDDAPDDVVAPPLVEAPDDVAPPAAPDGVDAPAPTVAAPDDVDGISVVAAPDGVDVPPVGPPDEEAPAFRRRRWHCHQTHKITSPTTSMDPPTPAPTAILAPRESGPLFGLVSFAAGPGPSLTGRPPATRKAETNKRAVTAFVDFIGRALVLKQWDWNRLSL
jgi:hypothetical protein